ncbi:MAG: hypothetical protein HFH50_14185 [Lachnospiraceae bacterium]|jgi:hypothetical protein|nr:hypothetical protein [Lachnospiraceae bacterium]
MKDIQKGIFIYEDYLEDVQIASLPTELAISDRISNEAVLIRLLLGTLHIKYFIGERQRALDQKNNYSIPGSIENDMLAEERIKDFFSLEEFDNTEKESINKYLKFNRRNHFIHEELLSELTNAIIWQKQSPIESFVHIYRTLEFMSYSFPLIYASKSMDYRGSYEKLKKFMSGDSDGELKFFKTFLKELFKDNILYAYEFDILFPSDNINLILAELQRVISENYYIFEGETMKIKFANVADLLITLRNRYFHMLIGKGTDNFYDIRYDKRELFSVMNPVFINWLTMIYKEIVVYSAGIII